MSTRRFPATVRGDQRELPDAPENYEHLPYGDGLDDQDPHVRPGELDGLMDAAAYQAHIAEEH